MNIDRAMAFIAKEMGINFTLQRKKADLDIAFSEDGVLPALLKRADHLSQFCLKEGLDIEFPESSDNQAGKSIQYGNKISATIRIMFAVEILFQLVESSPDRSQVSLDDFLYL